MKTAIKTLAFALSLSGLISCGDTGNPPSDKDAKVKGATASGIKIGETLHTQYFDVTVEKVKIADKVETGNEFADLAKEDGNKYLILDLKIKNTDSESRMMFDGEAHILNGDKTYKYEQPEMVGADGYGLIMDNINPDVTKKTKVVYKVPADASGSIFYQPGRGDGKIDCGKL